MCDLLLDIADVDGKLRPFELSLEEFDRLCRAYSVLCESHPGLIDYDPRSTGGIDDIKFENMCPKEIVTDVTN